MNYHDPEYLTRKLEHYNKWLLDPKRPAGEIYQGFPEDIKQAKAVAKLKADMENRPAKVVKEKIVRPPKAKRAKRASKQEGPTKLEQAIELYKANLHLSKDNMIDIIREKLVMSLAGATTYYYNARKANWN